MTLKWKYLLGVVQLKEKLFNFINFQVMMICYKPITPEKNYGNLGHIKFQKSAEIGQFWGKIVQFWVGKRSL